MATDNSKEVHELVGVADGEEVIDAFGNATGEKAVYEYDESGAFTGWHKEPLEGFAKDHEDGDVPRGPAGWAAGEEA